MLTHPTITQLRELKLDGMADAFAELLNCRQPIRITRDRRAANGQLDIFDAAISFRRRCLETCEAVEARDLPQAMHGDEVRDCD